MAAADAAEEFEFVRCTVGRLLVCFVHVFLMVGFVMEEQKGDWDFA